MNDDEALARDEHFMRLALRLAERALISGELPIGAVVVIRNEVIAEAYCSDKHQRMLAHPELLALMNADNKQPTPQQRRQMTLYTTLEPCVMCLGAAMSFSIGSLVFGMNAPADGATGRLSGISFGNASYPDYRMPHVVSGVLRDDCRSLFQRFARQSSDRVLVDFVEDILTVAIPPPSQSGGVATRTP